MYNQLLSVRQAAANTDTRSAPEDTSAGHTMLMRRSQGGARAPSPTAASTSAELSTQLSTQDSEGAAASDAGAVLQPHPGGVAASSMHPAAYARQQLLLQQAAGQLDVQPPLPLPPGLATQVSVCAAELAQQALGPGPACLARAHQLPAASHVQQQRQPHAQPPAADWQQRTARGWKRPGEAGPQLHAPPAAHQPPSAVGVGVGGAATSAWPQLEPQAAADIAAASYVGLHRQAEVARQNMDMLWWVAEAPARGGCRDCTHMPRLLAGGQASWPVAGSCAASTSSRRAAPGTCQPPDRHRMPLLICPAASCCPSASVATSTAQL